MLRLRERKTRKSFMTECECDLTLSTWKCYVLSVHIPAYRRTSISVCMHVQHIHDVCTHEHRQTDSKINNKIQKLKFFLCGNSLVVSTCILLCLEEILALLFCVDIVTKFCCPLNTVKRHIYITEMHIEL